MSVAFNSDVTLTVEIGFDSNPLDATQTFSDVSAYVRSIETNRGRQHALDEFQTGTCSVVLDNTDDRFNPLNTSSPYYDTSAGETKVKPFKKIRVSAEYDSTTYRIFTGFITGYPESFGGQGQDATVRVVAVDLFKLFNLNTIGSRGWSLGSPQRSLIGSTTTLSYSDEQELSSKRINRLLDAFGIPSTDRTMSTGSLEVQGGVSLDTNLLSALKAVEQAEQGQFFIGGDGKAIFRDRNYKISNQFNSNATFGNGVGELPFSDVITNFDESRIVNIVSVQRAGGVAQEVENTESIIEFGARAESLTDTLNVNDIDTDSIARQRLASFSNTSPRIEGLVVNPLGHTSLWEQTLGREIGDKITVKVPTPASTTMEFDVHIESIRHTINASNQTWSWNLSTSAGAETGAWIVGSSRLGQDTNLAW
jgi:hypothetical protein